jgi:hypothetical protein
VSSSGSGVPEFLEAVWANAKKKQPPAIADRYYLPGVKSLIALCAELQSAAGERTFFLACRHAGALLGENFRSISNWLKRLECDGVLKRISTGKKVTRRANEYRYMGDRN